VVSSRLQVGEGFYWIGAGGPDGPDVTIPDTGATGFVGVAHSLAMVLTGTQFGEIVVSVQSGDFDPGLDASGWDEVVEFSLTATPDSAGVGISAMDGGPEDLMALTPPGVGSYRIRLHARGRDAGSDLDVVEDDPVEEHLLQVWPAPAGGVVIRKASDAFGRATRGSAAQSGPDPRLPHGASVDIEVNQLVTRTDRAVVTLERAEVHAGGLVLQFRIVVDVSGLAPRQEKQARRAVDGYPKAAAPDSTGRGRLTVTLGFSDGRTAPFSDDTGALPRSGPAVTDFRTSSYPEGPAEVAEEGLWAWPLPPAGPLTVTVEWPAAGIPAASITLDATAFRSAAPA
jgi:hypothetical protein